MMSKKVAAILIVLTMMVSVMPARAIAADGDPTSVPFPTISSVSPSAGPIAGGTIIDIWGENLAGVTSVTIGGAPATDVIEIDSTRIRVTSPAGSVGAADLVVTTPGGTVTGRGGFTYIVPPAVTSVSSGSGNGTYGVNDRIEVEVSFDAPVRVYGMPQLTLETGGTDRLADYVAGNLTDTLTFYYYVQGGDTSVDLDYAATTSLTGTVYDSTGIVAANLTLPAPGTLGSLGANNDIVIDGFAPIVAIISPVANPTNVSLIPVAIAFSEPVTGLSLADIVVTNGTAANLNGRGSDYTVDIMPTILWGPFTAYVMAGAAEDAAGNGNIASAAISGIYDSLAPVVCISSAEPQTTNVSPIVVTITFSESVTGFGSDDIAITNGYLGSLSGSETVYTANVVANTDGTVTVDVAAGAASDAAGNGSEAAAQFSRTYDKAPPGVPSVTSVSSPTNDATPTWTWTGGGGGNGTYRYKLDDSDVTSGATVTTTAEYTPVVALSDGEHTLYVQERDDAGNWSPISGSFTVTVDTTPPSVTGLSDGGAYNHDVIPLFTGTATLNADPFASGNTVSGEGNYVLIVTDTAGNSTTVHFTIDKTVPTIFIAGPSSTRTNHGPVAYTVTYGGADNITLAAGDVTLCATGTAFGTIAVSDAGGSVRTVTISDITGDGVLGISIPAGSARDDAGNVAPAPPRSTMFTVDNTVPQIVTARIVSGPLAKPGDTVILDFSVDSPVETPTVTIAGHSVQAVPDGVADRRVWTAAYTMTGADNEGIVALGIQFCDLAGNVGAPANSTTDSSSVTFDKTPPGVSALTMRSSNTDIYLARTGDAVTLDLHTDEPVHVPTVTIAGQAVPAVDVGGGDGRAWTAVYMLAALDIEGQVPFSVQFSDLAGNAASPVTLTTDLRSVTFDRTAPQLTAVTIASSNADTSQAKVGDTIIVNLVADEAVKLPGVLIAGHRASVVDTGDRDARTWTATYTMTGTDTEGAVDCRVRFLDLAGNDGIEAAGTTNGSFVNFDRTPPEVTISGPSKAATHEDPVSFTISYAGASAVTLSSADVTLLKTGTADGTVTVASDGITTGTVTISEITGEGTLAISVAAETAADAAGNLAGAIGPSADVTVDKTAPTAAISAPSTSLTTNANVTFTVSYGEADYVTLAAGDVTLNRTGSADGLVSVSGSPLDASRWTVTIGAVTGDGALGISIAAATASDKAGNTAAAVGPSETFAVDNTMPTLIGASRTDDTHITLTLSEDCINLASASDGGFTVEETDTSGTTYAVASTAQGVDARHIVLTVSDTAASGFKGVTVTYTSGGRGAVSDVAGNLLESDAAGVKVGAWLYPPNEPEPFAASETHTVNGETVTTVTVDPNELERRLEGMEQGASIVIRIDTGADVVRGVLTGQSVKSMEEKEAVLEIRTRNVVYTLPASEINIDEICEQMGTDVSLSDIVVNITISEPGADTIKIVEDAASEGNYQIVVPPIEFEITCTSGSTTVEVSRFNGYVERTIAIPDGVDPSKITTGVVLNSDGALTHVPTRIVVIDGKYYVVINSLTNSVYTVIWNPVEFADVADHWAKEPVNDMGSRLIVNGVGGGLFEPDTDVTRAEFAAIVVRGLGLRPGAGASPFSDVDTSDWFCGYAKTAHE